jgi:GNAT superfamily N-acetyltransferase
MALSFETGTVADAPAIAALHCAVAESLTGKYGRGHWSRKVSEKGVLNGLRNSQVFMVRDAGEIVAAAWLGTKKPWAIDTRYFTPCRRPVYLGAMAVKPERQGEGIGRWCFLAARDEATAWPADAIRLDAYDTAAGAGAFYERCGCTEVGRVVYRGTPLIYYELLLKQPGGS